MSRVEKIGDAVLHLGDCLDILPTLPKVDAVITDPPYGISHVTSHGASWEGRQIANDGDTIARDAVREWCGARPWVMFGSHKAPPPRDFKGCIVWDKGPAFGMGDLKFPWKASFELVYIGAGPWIGKRDEGVLRGPVVVSWESAGRLHPHEKPVWLLAHFIDKLPSADVICDPFMGSGTTGAAAVMAGRGFVGIEVDPHHFGNACRRIEQAYAQRPLFEAEPVRAPEQLGLESA